MIGSSHFVKDRIEVDMTIGGNDWNLVEAKVTLSRNLVPNFVRIKKMAPAEGTTFERVEDLIGKGFELSIDTELESYRDAPGTYNSTLFKGNVANISSLGTGVYEAVIYDPSQQVLNQTENGGSVMNQEVKLTNPVVDYTTLSKAEKRYATDASETKFKPKGVVFRSSEALNKALKEVDLKGANDTEDVDIQLSKKGKVIGGPRGQFRGAIDNFVKFDSTKVTVEEILQKVANRTKSFWWFDRTGTFIFGVPDANIYYPELITDNSAGITTPPYQSIKVIGSDIASSNGYVQGELNPDEEVVVGGNITLSGSEPQLDSEKLQYGGSGTILHNPTFVYRNQEIITKAQAVNTLEKLAQDLGEQYANGKLTTVGFPEPSLFDVLVLPHANKDLQGVGNYNPRLPMGGSIFSVYKVEHMINPSDGFISRFHVAGTTAPASVKVSQSDFVQNPGVSDTIEEKGTEFEPPEEPQTAEELKKKAGTNAIEKIKNSDIKDKALEELRANANLGVNASFDQESFGSEFREESVEIASENGLLEESEEEQDTGTATTRSEQSSEEEDSEDFAGSDVDTGQGGPTGIGPPVDVANDDEEEYSPPSKPPYLDYTGVANDGNSEDDSDDDDDDDNNYGQTNPYTGR